MTWFSSSCLLQTWYAFGATSPQLWFHGGPEITVCSLMDVGPQITKMSEVCSLLQLKNVFVLKFFPMFVFSACDLIYLFSWFRFLRIIIKTNFPYIGIIKMKGSCKSLSCLYKCTPVLIRLHLNVFNTLRPRQNGRHFADDILKCIFLNENVWIPIAISLKFVPKGPIDNIPALV